MKTARPRQRVLHPYLGPGTVKAIHEEFKEICYFKPDFVPERFVGLQLVHISALEESRHDKAIHHLTRYKLDGYVCGN